MDYNSLFPDSTLTSAQAILLMMIVVWSLVWKGIALWKAARKGDTAWYVLILILNTIGIVEIFYIIFFSKAKKEVKVEEDKNK